MYVSTRDYNSTMDRYNDANQRRARIEADRQRAIRNLNQLRVHGDNVAREDRAAINAALERESKKLLDGLDGVSEDLLSELGSMNVRMREEIRRHDRQVAQLRDRTRELEETAQVYDTRIKEIDTHVTQLDHRAAHLSEEIVESNRTAQRIDDSVTSLSQDITRRFNELAERVSKQEDRARVYINQLQVVLDRINTLHPDKLLPEETTLVRQTLEAAIQDMNNGDYEAAIGLVQVRLPEAFLLEIKLQDMNEEFQRLLEVFLQQAELVGRQIEHMDKPEENNVVIAEAGENVKLGPEVPTISFDGRIDFWSNGWLSDENANLSDACQDVKELYLETMNIEGLQDKLETLEGIQRNLPACEVLAHNQYREHHALTETSRRIEEVLTDTAWKLEDQRYDGDDERNAFCMIFEDGDGHTASIVIVPNRWQVGAKYQAQFRLNVSEGANVEDEIICDILRTSLLSVLNSEQLSEGIISRRGVQPETSETNPNLARDMFLQSTMGLGGRIIDERISLARQMAGR